MLARSILLRRSAATVQSTPHPPIFSFPFNQRISGTTHKRTFATIIQQGTEGWRLSLGRNPVKVNPGLRLNVPFYHQILEVDMREQSATIKELSGFTSDNVPVSVSGSLFYKVSNSYDACFAVDNFAQNVAYIGTSAMRSVIGHFTYDEVIGDRNAINQKLHDVIGHSIQKWGVECTRFEIQNFHPSNRDVEKQLELQMAAERERRKKILDTQAMVNVAEGHKQRVILESEGALESQLNNAAGAKRKLILESEGTLEASKNEGKALAAQVDILARSLGHAESESDEPSVEHKLKALDALLELRRIEQLKAIANGRGNATYFFGGSNDGGSIDTSRYGVESWESWKRAVGVRGDVESVNADKGEGEGRGVGQEQTEPWSSGECSGVEGNILKSDQRRRRRDSGMSMTQSPRPDVPFVPPTV
ncbi:hypothetical protein BDY19DRAFT_723895 [Irpex rosettiformis]|uniref:Uncharacterized protein n=1 Tax=Irpex rosettiformis TaxID=378272 RepID=A0ACB8U8R7_9APHY|nr:hypothetical protein BDY19DRAFT_723895 [Irpex rosettiformis]